MNHLLVVRVLHGSAYLSKQPQTFAHPHFAVIAPTIDSDAFDILHDQVRQALGGCAAIEQPDDVRVVQSRRHLALGAETPQRLLPGHRGVNDFDGDALAVFAIRPLRQVYDSHSTVADFPQHAIGRNARRRFQGAIGGGGRIRPGGNRSRSCNFMAGDARKSPMRSSADSRDSIFSAVQAHGKPDRETRRGGRRQAPRSVAGSRLCAAKVPASLPLLTPVGPQICSPMILFPAIWCMST